MGAVFSVFIPMLHHVEGGFQKHPDDNGNYNSLGQLVGTNHGISAKFYETIIGRPPTEADIKAITKQEATNLYKIYFWDKVKASQINNQAVANTIVDHHVNSGRGVSLAQKVLNNDFGFNLIIDNAAGPITLNAINSVNPEDFVEKYNKARAAYYKSISNNESFIKGWLNRIKMFAYKNPGSTISAFTAITLIASFFLPLR
jgi:lysozyme family protein